MECPICYEELTTEIVTTKCNHTCHEECLKTWLDETNICPVCRTSNPYGEYNSVMPLPFWFNQDPGIAIPQIAMAYPPVRINFRLRNFDELVRGG